MIAPTWNKTVRGPPAGGNSLHQVCPKHLVQCLAHSSSINIYENIEKTNRLSYSLIQADKKTVHTT